MKFISDESCLHSGLIKNVSHLLYGLLGWTKLEGILNEHLLTCTCRREAAEVETRNMTIYQAMGGQATTCDWNLHCFSAYSMERVSQQRPKQGEGRMFQCFARNISGHCICLVLLHPMSACEMKARLFHLHNCQENSEAGLDHIWVGGTHRSQQPAWKGKLPPSVQQNNTLY